MLRSLYYGDSKYSGNADASETPEGSEKDLFDVLLPDIIKIRNGQRPPIKTKLDIVPYNEMLVLTRSCSSGRAEATLHINQTSANLVYGLEIVHPHKLTKVEICVNDTVLKSISSEGASETPRASGEANGIPAVINITDWFYSNVDYFFKSYNDIYFRFYGDFEDLTVFVKCGVARSKKIEDYGNPYYIFEQRYSWVFQGATFELSGSSNSPLTVMRVEFEEAYAAQVADVYGVNITAKNSYYHITSILPSEIKKESSAIEFMLPIYIRLRAVEALCFQIMGIKSNTRYNISVGVYNLLLYSGGVHAVRYINNKPLAEPIS